jgi:ankyrin repeat protein
MKKIALLLILPFVFLGVSLRSPGQAGSNELNDRLIQAAAAGDTAAVEQLLQQGADINAQDRFGNTALIMAVQFDKVEMVKLLLRKGADPNGAGGGALLTAIDGDKLEIVKLLLEGGANVDVVENTGTTPLIEAVQRNNSAMVKLLLNKGANPNVRNKNGCSALYMAAGQDDAEFVRLLLDHGADINEANVAQETALHQASLNGRAAVVKLLIERGAKTEAKAEFASTPLHEAAHWCQPEAARALIEGGANVEARNDRAETPLHFAAHRGCTPVVKLLLDRGARIEARSDDGMTPLMYAAESGGDLHMKKDGIDAEIYPAPDVINLLLDRGADIEARSDWGQTALHRAAFLRRPDSVKALLQRGANIQAIDNHGETPLFLANQVRRSFESVVEENMRIDPSGYYQRSADILRKANQEVIEILESALPRHPPRTFAEYVSDMQNHPLDGARRQNVVRLAAALPVLPPVPQQASVLCAKGTALMERANDAKERQLAVNVLRGASVVAPWWRDVYLQLSRALELNGQYDFAIRDLEYYLELHPGEADARTARNHLRELEARQRTTTAK